MQIAIDVAGFTPTEADELRQAMSAKRLGERMAHLRGRLFAGMASRQVSADVAEQVYTALAAFANFGFPESHSVAFAHLVYATAWCKVHYPAAFTRRPPQRSAHGVLVPAEPGGRRQASWGGGAPTRRERRRGRRRARDTVGVGRRTVRTGCPAGRVLGTRYRQRDCGADRRGAPLVEHGGPGPPGRRLPAPSWRRWPRPAPSTAWGRGWVTTGGPWCGGRERPPRPPSRPAPRGRHRLGSPTPAPAHPVGRGGRRPVVARDGPRHHGHGVGSRRHWTDWGCWPRPALRSRPAGDRITVGGVVTHRQQPESAHGAVFMNLEDETGMVNIVCSPAPGGPGSGGSRWPGRARRCWYGDGSSVRRGR